MEDASSSVRIEGREETSCVSQMRLSLFSDDRHRRERAGCPVENQVENVLITAFCDVSLLLLRTVTGSIMRNMC